MEAHSASLLCINNGFFLGFNLWFFSVNNGCCVKREEEEMGEITEKKSTKKKKNSISTSPCAQLRSAYHQCFNRWYSEKFVKGQWDKEECVSEWEKYRACLSQHLDDKHLSRFLEAESMYSTAPDDDPARFFASGGGGRSH